MADITHFDRGVAAQNEILDRHASRTAQVREQSNRLISNVLMRTKGWAEIDINLALGRVCPFTSKYDLIIWLEEVNRLQQETK